MWKRANKHDPASREDKVRFFVQNQLGAIITLIAFLPLLAMVFLDKDMDPKTKKVAGGSAHCAAKPSILGLSPKPTPKMLCV